MHKICLQIGIDEYCTTFGEKISGVCGQCSALLSVRTFVNGGKVCVHVCLGAPASLSERPEGWRDGASESKSERGGGREGGSGGGGAVGEGAVK